MRLLDIIAQYRKPFVIAPRAQDAQPIVMNGPSDFADRIARCPLRFVIADNLTRASAELAFADGDRLAGCLDLLGIPAPLLWVDGATRPVPVQRDQLNRKRMERNRPPLLDHIEVHATLPAHSSGSNADEGGVITRRPPRLHQVRGHLVRRDNSVFWRTPHLRGSERQGVVRSRTVCLSFSRVS